MQIQKLPNTEPNAQEDEVIQRALDAALDAACEVIQKHLGVTTGDYAALHFSGSGSDAIRRDLTAYFTEEKRRMTVEQAGESPERWLGTPVQVSMEKALEGWGAEHDDAVSALVYRDAVYILRLKDGQYYTITGTSEITTPELRQAESFLAKYVADACELEPLYDAPNGPAEQSVKASRSASPR